MGKERKNKEISEEEMREFERKIIPFSRRGIMQENLRAVNLRIIFFVAIILVGIFPDTNVEMNLRRILPETYIF